MTIIRSRVIRACGEQTCLSGGRGPGAGPEAKRLIVVLGDKLQWGGVCSLRGRRGEPGKFPGALWAVDSAGLTLRVLVVVG